MRVAQSSHILIGSLLAPCLPSAPGQRGSSSVYLATTMAPLLVHGLRCQEELVGLSCDPLASCLWQWGCWQGSTILNFRQGGSSLVRFLRAGPAPWPFFSFGIQDSPTSCMRRKNTKGRKDEWGKEWQILNKLSHEKAHLLILLTSRKCYY